MRGPKPKSTERKKLEGNPGKRKLNDFEPILPTVTEHFDMVPQELETDPVAAAEWARLAPMLRRSRAITQAERSSLIALCREWSIYLYAGGQVKKLGMVVKAPSGYPMVNPYLAIGNKALHACTRLWAELGLTPSSRSRVVAAAEGSTGIPGDSDPFAEFDISALRNVN